MSDKCRKDIKVAESKIGWVSNKGQVAQSQLNHMKLHRNEYTQKQIDEMEEIVYRLKNAQDVCIDNAKRQSALNIFGKEGELEELNSSEAWIKHKNVKDKYVITKPKFMDKNVSDKLDCNMQLLFDVVNNNVEIADTSETKALKDLLILDCEGKVDRKKISRLLNGNDYKTKNGTAHKDGIIDINNRIRKNRQLLNDVTKAKDKDELFELISIDKKNIRDLVSKTSLDEATTRQLIKDCLLSDKYSNGVDTEILNALYKKDKNKFLACFKEGVTIPSSSILESNINEGMKEVHNMADEVIKQCDNLIDKAIDDINNEVNKIFDTIRGREGQLTEKEIRALLDERIDLANYKARISRWEAVKDCIERNTKELSEGLTQAQEGLYGDVIKNGYHRSMYNIDNRFGFGINFGLITKEDINRILSTNFLSSTFYKRIQNNCGTLQNVVNDTIKKGLLSGKSLWKISKELQENSHYGKMASRRLVRTEVSHFYNEGSLESYKEIGIDSFRFVATLDSRTSTKCRDMDGRVFNTKEAEQGVNMPPLHPWCRSTTIGVYDDVDISRLKRRTREGVIDYSTYHEWAKDRGIE